VVNEGLLISSEIVVRADWKETIERSKAKNGHEALDDEWLNLPLSSDETLEW